MNHLWELIICLFMQPTTVLKTPLIIFYEQYKVQAVHCKLFIQFSKLFRKYIFRYLSYGKNGALQKCITENHIIRK